MKTITSALVAGVLAFTSAEAAACNIGRISGTWDVLVTDVRYVPWPRGETVSAVCSFEVSRNRKDVANLNVFCPQVTTTYRGGPMGLTPFVLEGDNVFGDPSEPSVFPWHQLHHDRGCTWTMVDLNGVDLDYTVRFSRDVLTLIGSGSEGGDGHHPAVGRLVQFHGIKR